MKGGRGLPPKAEPHETALVGPQNQRGAGREGGPKLSAGDPKPLWGTWKICGAGGPKVSRPPRNFGGGEAQIWRFRPQIPARKKPQRPKSRWGEGGTSPAPFIAPSPGGGLPTQISVWGGPEPLFTASQVRVWGVPSESPKSQFWGGLLSSPQLPRRSLSFLQSPQTHFEGSFRTVGVLGGIFGRFRGSLSLLWGSSGSRCPAQALRSSGSATSGEGNAAGTPPQ